MDKKSQAIKDKINQRAGVYILPEQQCVDVQWAQYSQGEATLQLLSATVNRGVQPLFPNQWSRFSIEVY